MRIEKGRDRIPQMRVQRKTGVLLFSVIFFAILFFFGSFQLYVGHAYGATARTVTKFVPLPAAVVSDEIVWMRDVVELAHFASLVNADDPYRVGYETAIKRAIMRELSEKEGVVAEGGYAEIDHEILALTGWSEKEYRRFVSQPFALQKALEAAVYGSVEYQKGAREAAQRLRSQHEEIGIAFSDLAYQYSEGASRVDEGWLGYFFEDEMPEVYRSLWEGDVGSVYIVERERSFAIVRIYDGIEVGDGLEQMALQEIIVQKQTLGEVLEQYRQEHGLRLSFVQW